VLRSAVISLVLAFLLFPGIFYRLFFSDNQAAAFFLKSSLKVLGASDCLSDVFLGGRSVLEFLLSGERFELLVSQYLFRGFCAA